MLLPIFTAVTGGVPSQQTLTVTDTTPAYSSSAPGGYGTPNPAKADVARLLLVAPLLPTGRFQGPALVPAADPGGSFSSPFSDTTNVATLTLPDDALYMVRLFTVWRITTVPSNAPTGTLFSNPAGGLFTVTSPNSAAQVSLDDILVDAQTGNSYLSQGEGLRFALATRNTEARLGTWLLQLAEHNCRTRPEVDPWLDADLLLRAVREEIKQGRMPQGAALFQQVLRLLKHRPLTLQQAVCPC